jgi:hypothetical protein
MGWAIIARPVAMLSRLSFGFSEPISEELHHNSHLLMFALCNGAGYKVLSYGIDHATSSAGARFAISNSTGSITTSTEFDSENSSFALLTVFAVWTLEPSPASSNWTSYAQVNSAQVKWETVYRVDLRSCRCVCMKRHQSQSK